MNYEQKKKIVIRKLTTDRYENIYGKKKKEEEIQRLNKCNCIAYFIFFLFAKICVKEKKGRLYKQFVVLRNLEIYRIA